MNRSVPDTLSQLESLLYLNLSKNLLQKIPEGLFINSKRMVLEDLILFSNSINEIDNRIDSLHRLNHLDLNENKIQHVPITLGNCQSLTVLKLAFNSIIELPDNCMVVLFFLIPIYCFSWRFE